VFFGKFALSAALFSAIGCASVTAHAQKTGFYAGGAVGRLDYSIDTADFNSGGARVTSKDDKAIGWRVFGGYQFNKYIGAEAGYAGLGKFSVKGTVNGSPFTASAKTDGYTLALVGTLPLNDKLAFFGKMGGIRSKSKATASAANVRLTDSGHNNGSLVGAGIKYSFNPQFALRLEAERFGLGDGDSVYLYSLGAQYTF
jgi:OmpA-OmpF porin, OOP family